MNVGQVELVKLFERPPSKKPGSGLDEAVEELSVEVEDADVVVVELVNVDTGISKVVVTEAVTVLFFNSCSSGCRAVHFPSSTSRILVSMTSSSIRSGVATGWVVGVARGVPSRLGSQMSTTRAGTGSSSSGDARTRDAHNNATPSALAQCLGCVLDDDGNDVRIVADELQRGAKRVNEAMIISRRQRACGTCMTLFE